MVGLEPTRDTLLSGLADQRVYHFRHTSTLTGAPGFEPEASVLETEMLSGYTTLLRQSTLIPKAGFEPACDVYAP